MNPAEAQSFTRGSVLHRLARCPWQLQVTTNKLQCLSRASTFAQTNISEAKKWDDRDSEDGERQLVLQHLAMSDRHRGGTHWTWAGLAILSFFIQIPKFGQFFFWRLPFNIIWNLNYEENSHRRKLFDFVITCARRTRKYGWLALCALGVWGWYKK